MEIRPSSRGTCTIKLPRPVTTQVSTLLAQLPGFRKWDGWDMTFRPTAKNVEHILINFPNAKWLDGAAEHVIEFQYRAAEAARSVAGKLGTLNTEDGYVYKTEPWDHQRRAFLLSRERPEYALLMEQRTGKTKVIIDTAAYNYAKNRFHTLIIVSVNGVHRNWIDNEIPDHLPDRVPWGGWFSRSSSRSKDQRDKFEQLLGAKDRLRVFAFHFEGFSASALAEYFEAAIGDGSGVILVADESTRIKNRTSGRAKYLIRFGKPADMKRILTGTPVVKDPEDLFGQFYFLDPEILGYDTVTTFRARYVQRKWVETRDGRKFPVKTGFTNTEELTKAIDGYSFRVLRKDCMDLPAKVYKRFPVELTPLQRTLYNELKKEYIAEHRGVTLTAELAMTRALRLQQILCNWWPMEESELAGGETWLKVKPISDANPRMDAVDTIIRQAEEGAKIVFWARFRPDLQSILKHLNGARIQPAAVSYHGGNSADTNAHNYSKFKKDPHCLYMVANPASAGLGLDFSVADTEVYYSNSYNLEHRLQSEDRIEKKGKKFANLVWDIEAPGTEDSRIIKNLRDKKDVAEQIIGDPHSFFMVEED